MRAPLLSLLFGYTLTGFGCASAPKPPVAAPLNTEIHSSHYRAYVYRFEGDLAVPMGSVEKESSGLSHVTIVGAVEKPGAYYFSGKLKIETLIPAAKPIRTGLGCGSAWLYQVTISSSKRFDNRDSFVINYLKYMAAKGPSGRVPIEFSGGEVVYIPEVF